MNVRQINIFKYIYHVMTSLPFMITRNLENLMKMKVEIISSKFIKPSLPTPPTHRKYKLSFFDQLAPPAYPGIVFFFLSNDKNHEAQAENDNVKWLKQLEKSLSDILVHFYPLAGKYVKEDLLVDCNDQGVEVFEARVHNISLAELVHGRPELVDSFAPTAMAMASSNPSPVAAIQISTFEQGGFAVGMRISHKIIDGFTQATFIKEWAIASKEGIEKAMWPSFELGSLFPARELSDLKPHPRRDQGVKKLVAKRFVLDAARISTLKAKVVGVSLGTPPKRQPSRILVVTALIWRTLIDIARAKHGYLRPSVLSLSMDLRERTGLQPPKNPFGNLFTHSTARFMAEENKMELHDLVFLLKEAINKTSEDYANVQHGDDIYSMLINHYNENGADKPSNADFFYFSSLRKFSCYEVDFGWGQPAWVTTTSKPVELISLMDTKCGEGIEVSMTLNEDDMREFECHPDIVALSSAEILTRALPKE
ncbi:unnamed protein product [Camellia sinensis]